MIYVNSYGGSGSKYLVKQIIRAYPKFEATDIHHHIRDVSSISITNEDKMIFVFSNPIDAVKSFFGRQELNTEQHGFNGKIGEGSMNWPFRHCRNIDGNYIGFDKSWKLNDFIANGKDLFQLESFFDNWYLNDSLPEMLFVNYDCIWEHRSLIKDFLGINPKFEFEEFKPRTRYDFKLSEEEHLKLESLYSKLANKILNLETIFFK